MEIISNRSDSIEDSKNETEENKEVKKEETRKQLIWAIEIYERVTGSIRVFARILRTYQIMKDICIEHIKPGSNLYTDG